MNELKQMMLLDLIMKEQIYLWNEANAMIILEPFTYNTDADGWSGYEGTHLSLKLGEWRDSSGDFWAEGKRLLKERRKVEQVVKDQYFVRILAKRITFYL